MVLLDRSVQKLRLKDETPCLYTKILIYITTKIPKHLQILI